MIANILLRRKFIFCALMMTCWYVVVFKLDYRFLNKIATKKTKAYPKFKVDIVHVVSLFKVDDCDQRFCPFNQDQSIVIESMRRAKAMASSSIAFFVPTYDRDSAIIPTDFYNSPDLNRSSLTEYPLLEPKKEFPFIQDIFDSLLASDIDFDYVIYTNADIILHENFYNIVNEQITKDYDAFTINRQTVNKFRGTIEDDLYTSFDLDEIFDLPTTEHGGYDCFVMKKDIFKQVDMGNVFIGNPPIGNILLDQMRHFASRFHLFNTHDLNATFHLGSERNWKKFAGQHGLQNEYNAKEIRTAIQSVL